MSNVKNIKKSIGNTFSAATAVVSVSTEVVADASGFVSSSIGSTPAVLKALLQAPFSAAKGYLMEAEDMTEEEAELAAFKYINQEVAVTVKQGGEASGKLIAQLFAEEVDDADDSAKKQA